MVHGFDLKKAAAGGAPKVYCFSISTKPQAIWQKCAEISGGSVNMVEWMTKPGGQPPADAGNVVDDIDKGPSRTPAKIR